MVLHDPDRITDPFQRQLWQGSGQGMQMHEKRCIKRAGVARIALRADGANMYALVCASVLLCGFLIWCRLGLAARNYRLRNDYAHVCGMSPLRARVAPQIDTMKCLKWCHFVVL